MAHEDQERQTLDENSTPQPGTDKKGTGKKGMKIDKKTAVVSTAIGIGSAAIVAALLYTNRNNKS